MTSSFDINGILPATLVTSITVLATALFLAHPPAVILWLVIPVVTAAVAQFVVLMLPSNKRPTSDCANSDDMAEMISFYKRSNGPDALLEHPTSGPTVHETTSANKTAVADNNFWTASIITTGGDPVLASLSSPKQAPAAGAAPATSDSPCSAKQNDTCLPPLESNEPSLHCFYSASDGSKINDASDLEHIYPWRWLRFETVSLPCHTIPWITAASCHDHDDKEDEDAADLAQNNFVANGQPHGETVPPVESDPLVVIGARLKVFDSSLSCAPTSPGMLPPVAKDESGEEAENISEGNEVARTTTKLPVDNTDQTPPNMSTGLLLSPDDTVYVTAPWSVGRLRERVYDALLGFTVGQGLLPQSPKAAADTTGSSEDDVDVSEGNSMLLDPVKGVVMLDADGAADVSAVRQDDEQPSSPLSVKSMNSPRDLGAGTPDQREHEPAHLGHASPNNSVPLSSLQDVEDEGDGIVSRASTPEEDFLAGYVSAQPSTVTTASHSSGCLVVLVLDDMSNVDGGVQDLLFQ